MMADLLSASDEAQAPEDLHQRGCTDGLPVVIPTPDRVSRMVLASGQDADRRYRLRLNQSRHELVLEAMDPDRGSSSIGAARNP